MKATGIIRRIDDLGRVVLPKELRRSLRLREGTPLEIFVGDEGTIVLKKYSVVNEWEPMVSEYVHSLAESTGLTVCVTDMEQVVVAAGCGKRDMLKNKISINLEKIIHSKETIIALKGNSNFIDITECDSDIKSEAIAPIISNGDAVGSLIMLNMNEKVKMGILERKLVQTGASYLGKQLGD